MLNAAVRSALSITAPPLPSVFASDGPVPVARTAPNGTKIRVNEFPPGVVSPVHRTQSVDYGHRAVL